MRLDFTRYEVNVHRMYREKPWRLTVLKYSMPVAAKLAAMSGVVTTAATGCPLPIGLPSVTMSGTISATSRYQSMYLFHVENAYNTEGRDGQKREKQKKERRFLRNIILDSVSCAKVPITHSHPATARSQLAPPRKMCIRPNTIRKAETSPSVLNRAYGFSPVFRLNPSSVKDRFWDFYRFSVIRMSTAR